MFGGGWGCGEFEAVLDKFGLKGDLGDMPGSMGTRVNWGRDQVWSGTRK